MKRLKTLLLGGLAFLVAFCAGFGFVGANCENSKVDQYGFLSQEILTQKRIPNFPQLPHGEYTRTTDVRFYATITYDEFESYVEQVYDYLSSCEFKLWNERKMVRLGKNRKGM